MIEREVILLANEGAPHKSDGISETDVDEAAMRLFTSYPVVPLDPIDPAFGALINTMNPGMVVQQVFLLLLCFILLGAAVTAAGYLIPSL